MKVKTSTLIGVVSDTHSKPLPARMMADLRKTDFIIHAGDMCGLEDYEAFAKIRDVKAVHGNMDVPEIRKRFPRRQILECGSARIGLFHGEGSPKTTLGKVQEEFADEKVDAVVFGHSHVPFNEKIDGVLYFNPGSPNDNIFAPYCSYGLLEVLPDGGVKGRIVKVSG